MDPDHVVRTMITQWQRERPDLDPGPMALFGRLTRADALAGRAIATTLAAHDLNRGEFDVLATLRRSGAPYALPAGTLSGALLLSAGAMTNRLDRLEAAGLVTRTPRAEDRRSMLVSLTPSGRERVDAAATAHVRNLQAMLGALTPRQQARLSELLAALLSALGSRP